jgi:hypothetical protein
MCDPPARIVATSVRTLRPGNVRLRLARLASVKYGLSGINWGNRFDLAWLRNLGIYELVGSVRYRPTQALR